MIRNVFFAVLLSAGLVHAEADIAQVKIGDKISGPLTIGKNVFPLPSGEWEVVNMASRDLIILTEGMKQKFDSLQSVQLFKSKQGKLLETMSIDTPVNNSAFQITKDSSKSCDAKTGYFYTDFDSGYNLPECLIVSHAVNYYEIGNLNKFYSETKSYFDKNNISLPKTVISSVYYYSSKHSATTIRFSFNPELAGFPPSTVKNWTANEWHKDKMNAEQKQFSSRAVEWSKKMATSMQKAIQKKEITELPDFMESVLAAKQ